MVQNINTALLVHRLSYLQLLESDSAGGCWFNFILVHSVPVDWRKQMTNEIIITASCHGRGWRGYHQRASGVVAWWLLLLFFCFNPVKLLFFFPEKSSSKQAEDPAFGCFHSHQITERASFCQLRRSVWRRIPYFPESTPAEAWRGQAVGRRES